MGQTKIAGALIGGDLWQVKKSLVDLGTELRHIEKLLVSDNDKEEQILTLRTLRDEMKQPGFEFVE